MFYIYAHYTPNRQLFYIGKGSKKRAYSFYKRGSHWNNIVNKYGTPTVEILAEFKLEQDAFNQEISLIAQYRSEGIELCNKTDGGEGTSGYKFTAEQVENNRLAHIGQPAWNKGMPCREVTKLKIHLAKIGKPGKTMTIEAKTKISIANTGNKHTEETKVKCGLANKGKPTSAKQKATASILFKGNTYGAGNTTNRAWIWVGTQVETKEVVRIIGEKAMKEAGFQHANIIKCINGQRKSHKGYTWAKESWGNA